MTSTTKRKYVSDEVLYDYSLPDAERGERVVRCAGGRGNNLHEVEDEGGNRFLVSMPTKFRRSIWVKRGDYILVSPIQEGDKVKAEITRVLYKEQIKHFKKEGVWPFKDQQEEVETKLGDLKVKEEEGSEEDSDASEDDDDDDDLFVNTNRRVVEYSEEETSSEEEEEEEEEEK